MLCMPPSADATGRPLGIKRVGGERLDLLHKLCDFLHVPILRFLRGDIVRPAGDDLTRDLRKISLNRFMRYDTGRPVNCYGG